LKARPFLKDTFLLAYGDTFCRLDLSSMYALHKNNSSIATVALATSPDPKKFGVAMVEGSKVKGFSEKPKKDLVHCQRALYK
jgi:NDP-sugar pyrophosphorylase family protein